MINGDITAHLEKVNLISFIENNLKSFKSDIKFEHTTEKTYVMIDKKYIRAGTFNCIRSYKSNEWKNICTV